MISIYPDYTHCGSLGKQQCAKYETATATACETWKLDPSNLRFPLYWFDEVIDYKIFLKEGSGRTTPAAAIYKPLAIAVNLPRVNFKNYGEHLAALLNHEVGHLLKYPGSATKNQQLIQRCNDWHCGKNITKEEIGNAYNVYLDVWVNTYIHNTLKFDMSGLVTVQQPCWDWAKAQKVLYSYLWQKPNSTLVTFDQEPRISKKAADWLPLFALNTTAWDASLEEFLNSYFA